MSNAPEDLSDDYGAFGIPAHSFLKNSREQIRIGLNEYKGHEYIDVRAFYMAKTGWRPSSKGVTIPVGMYPDLLRGILELGGQLGHLSQEFLAELELPGPEAGTPGEPN